VWLHHDAVWPHHDAVWPHHDAVWLHHDAVWLHHDAVWLHHDAVWPHRTELQPPFLHRHVPAAARGRLALADPAARINIVARKDRLAKGPTAPRLRGVGY
jgi:hypothetical protein